ncbi:MAG: hypothetical protein LQ350_002243 [Teloschistes chrysophthalmus]|nr:MAG: hypothetical protein LQ350_002243 [Niorma chrysophthalma]
MSSGVRHGKPDEEMFLQRPSDSPTVEPLRINKRDSRSPEQNDSRAGSAAFPLPPGASSSPAPLPYPDDREPTQRAANPRAPQVAFADRTTTIGQSRPSPAPSSSPPPSTGSADPRKYGRYEYPAALRPREGRDGQPTSRLAERRANIPKPLPDSPGPEAPDKEGLFQRMPQRDGPKASQSSGQAPAAENNPYPEYYQQYWPPPGESSSPAPAQSSGLRVPNPISVNRISSTASTSTTRAQRGSPPPPETPIIGPGEQPGGGIEARYAAAGIAGASTLTNLQAQNAAAAQRAQQYNAQPARRPSPAAQPQQSPPRRPWTPTEQPGSQPHGPPTVYQGPSQATSPPPVLHAPTPQGRVSSPASQPGRGSAPNALEQDFQRMHVSASPPPAYTPAGPSATSAQGYPNEKHGLNPSVAPGASAVGVTPDAAHQGHPAFANDARHLNDPSLLQPGQNNPNAPTQQYAKTSSPGPAAPGPASPPPLPEGWIAHLDPNSGQYYYIHLPTQSTQWEFPKGPTPLNLNEPLSPTLSTYGGHPLASPGLSAFSKPLASPAFQPSTPGYPESVMSMQSATPTVAGFSGPPPTAGVDMYKVAPTNGVYFGPYLRYTNMDLERGIWLGSILLITDAPQPPTIHIHQSIDLSPNPRQLKANSISVHQRWTFYRYDVDLQMEEDAGAKWTYAITSHLGCTRYEFLVAGRHESSWRFIATSGNDFSLNVNANERSKLGGIGYMWKDIMQKHVECGGFHTQLGLGDQIYADRIWKEIPLLKQWLATSGKENRKNAQWTAKHEEDVSHAYFHYYTSHFDQPYLREAFAQIPHVLQLDDHDILEAAEQIAHTVATGKKAVTGTYNLLGKVTSSVAGVVGAKGVVGSGFDSVKKAVGKSGLMGGILSPFGDIDVLDELRDQWTHESKDLERTYLIRTLQGIAHQKSLRMTFLSGAVDCCGAGLVHDPAKPSDHKTMYQIISASVVNTPPASYVLKMLHNHKPLYVPANGHRSTNAPSDTKEDMMEIFQQEPDGRPREMKKLMGRRNYVAIVAYDPEVVQGTYGRTDMAKGTGKLSLAVDFIVQSDPNAGGFSSGGVNKYGPVIIPTLEFGR